MQKKPISPEDFVVIMSEMCDRVGLDYNALKDGDFFRHDGWYQHYRWSEEDQDNFADWLAAYLRQNKYCGARKYRGQDAGHHLAWKFLLDYGWTTAKIR